MFISAIPSHRHNHRIQWDGRDMFLKFSAEEKTVFKLRRSPHATVGEPWPMPQEYVTNDNKVFLLDHRKFTIQTPEVTCDVLNLAVKRYEDLIFIHASEDFEDNLDNIKNIKLHSHEKTNEENIYSSSDHVTKLIIYINRSVCSEYSTESSDESCKFTAVDFGRLALLRAYFKYFVVNFIAIINYGSSAHSP